MFIITDIKVHDEKTNVLIESLSKRHLRIPCADRKAFQDMALVINEETNIKWREQSQPLISAGIRPGETRELRILLIYRDLSERMHQTGSYTLEREEAVALEL